MFTPFPADEPDVEKTLTLQALLGDQVFNPIAQFIAKPVFNRNPKTHFGTVNQR
jgi:hypothetical protein